jgi:predicted transcriptional regulator
VTKAFPIDSLKKRYIHNGTNDILNKKFKVEFHHTYYNFELKNMSFIEKLDNLSVYEDKIKNFLKQYEKSDNEVVNKIRKEWYEYSKDG